MTIINWDTDPEYQEWKLTKVEPGEKGWSLYADGCGIFCPGDLCSQAPAVGETARLYGKGFGYRVRGIVIEGRVYYYLPEAEDQKAQLDERLAAQRERMRELERDRPERDRRRAALPEVFRERLAEYERRNPMWRAEFEPYELSVCEDAVAVAKHCGEPSSPEALRALEAFRALEWQAQKAAIPTLFDGHSGNSWGCALHLAARYIQSPTYVRGAHGALCPLVGCKEYGCPGADVKGPSDG